MAAIPPVRWHLYLELEFTLSTIGETRELLRLFRKPPMVNWWHRVTPEVLKVLRDKIRRVPVKAIFE